MNRSARFVGEVLFKACATAVKVQERRETLRKFEKLIVAEKNWAAMIVCC